MSLSFYANTTIPLLTGIPDNNKAK